MGREENFQKSFVVHPTSPHTKGNHLELRYDTSCVFFARIFKTPSFLIMWSGIILCGNHTHAYKHKVKIFLLYICDKDDINHFSCHICLVVVRIKCERGLCSGGYNHVTDISLWRGCAVRHDGA